MYLVLKSWAPEFVLAVQALHDVESLPAENKAASGDGDAAVTCFHLVSATTSQEICEY